MAMHTEHRPDTGAVIPPDVYDPNVNALRFLAVDAVNRANSGHPGTPLDVAPVIYRLFTRHLRHDPADPQWPDRDRFVLSGRHASMILYGALHLYMFKAFAWGPQPRELAAASLFLDKLGLAGILPPMQVRARPGAGT